MNNIEHHKTILNDIHATYIRKNNDYGDSFGKSIEKYGNISALVRMSDKWNRLENLVLNGNQMVNDESVQDTCLDLANYLIMFVMELRKHNVNVSNKPTEDELIEMLNYTE